MRYPKRSQYKYAQSPYRVRNWADYEAGLQRRGALTIWLSDTALEAWRAPATGRPGGHENLRCSRMGGDEAIHLLIDSTGLRAHVGHLRKPPKRRVWRKLHLAVNADTGEVLALDLTNRRTADCARVPKLLDQIDGSLASVAADGAYDARAVYEAAQGKGNGNRVRVLIPPSRGAQPSSIRSPGLRERNRNIRSVRRLGRKEWFASSGYGRRSLVENAVFRYKAILGHRMRSRSPGSQRIEVDLARKILNTMTSLGMPDSVRVR
jgi:hypothetical protein